MIGDERKTNSTIITDVHRSEMPRIRFIYEDDSSATGLGAYCISFRTEHNSKQGFSSFALSSAMSFGRRRQRMLTDYQTAGRKLVHKAKATGKGKA